jgi:hypothetical protein
MESQRVPSFISSSYFPFLSPRKPDFTLYCKIPHKMKYFVSYGVWVGVGKACGAR